MPGLILRTLAELVAFGVGALALGTLVLRRLGGGSVPLRLLVGLGAGGYVAIALAFAHALRWWTLLLVGGAAFAATQRELRALRLPRGDHVTTALTAVAAAMGIGQLLAALAPPEAYDELAYHLPIARALGTDAAMQLLHAPDPYGNLPGLGEAITAAGLTVHGPALAHALHLAVLLAFVALAGRVVGELAGPRVGALAAIALLAYPELTYNATTAYVDATATSFELGAVLLVLRRNLPGAAILLGLALSVKYTALFTAAVLGVAVLVFLARRRALRDGLVPVTLVLVTCGFWYAKNLVRFGNPFWPFYLGHSGMDERTYEGFIAGVRAFGPRTLGTFVELPWRLASDETAVPFLALSLVVLALAVRPSRALGAYAGLYATYWFWLATHQVRFLLTAAAAAILAVVVAMARGGRTFRLALAAAAIAAVAVTQVRIHAFSLSAAGEALAGPFGHPKALYALGLESRNAYYERYLGCTFTAVRFLDEHPSLSPVLVPQTALAPWTARRTRFGKLPLTTRTPAAALHASRGFRSVLLVSGGPGNLATTDAADRALRARLRPLWRDGVCAVMRLPL